MSYTEAKEIPRDDEQIFVRRTTRLIKLKVGKQPNSEGASEPSRFTYIFRSPVRSETIVVPSTRRFLSVLEAKISQVNSNARSPFRGGRKKIIEELDCITGN